MTLRFLFQIHITYSFLIKHFGLLVFILDSISAIGNALNLVNPTSVSHALIACSWPSGNVRLTGSNVGNSEPSGKQTPTQLFITPMQLPDSGKIRSRP